MESELVTDNLVGLTHRFGSSLAFKREANGYIKAKKGAGWKYLNFVTAQRLAHGIGEYLLLNPETRVGRNGVQSSRMWYELLANQGVAISYDSRQDSYQFAQIFAAVFARYYKQIRAYLVA